MLVLGTPSFSPFGAPNPLAFSGRPFASPGPRFVVVSGT